MEQRLVTLVFLALGLALVIGGGVGYLFGYDHGLERVVISNFEDCKAAGYPVMESYPEQCATPDGRTFVREIPVAEVWGTVYGHTSLGPVCPVETTFPDPSCAARAYEMRLTLTTADGAQAIREFTTATDGTFSVDVAPGTYMIRSAALANVLPYCQSRVFTVPTNDSVEVAVECDTGIRGPEPVVCTMEAKVCPDGSYVGRTGPTCEFAFCP